MFVVEIVQELIQFVLQHAESICSNFQILHEYAEYDDDIYIYNERKRITSLLSLSNTVRKKCKVAYKQFIFRLPPWKVAECFEKQLS